MKPVGKLVPLLFVTAAALSLSCTQPTLEPGSGFVDVTGGRVWYEIHGGGVATPLLILHGGPGIPSYYLNPLATLSDERPVVFYDQLGAGRSPAPNDTTWWKVDHFVKEIGEVRAALGLDEVHLYGHSWGALIAAAYAIDHPEGVKSLILAGPALSLPRWEADVRNLLTTMDDTIQTTIETHEEAGTTDSPEFQAAMMEFYRTYVARKQPWPDDLDSAFAGMNPELYGYMLGPSEFTITGTLKGYDLTDRLKEINVPTLISIGEYDEVPAATADYYASLVPGAKVVVVPGSGHLTALDNMEADARNISEFLKEVEK